MKPKGIAHLRFVLDRGKIRSDHFALAIQADTPWARLIGISLEALYAVSTCEAKCYGGDHLVERLAGRSYNLAASAVLLIDSHYYDEAFVLIRSLGEIANLVQLFADDFHEFERWRSASRSERIKKFGPAAVRKKLKKEPVLAVSEDKYSELCEAFTHPTPSITPNSHMGAKQSVVGGLYQKQGSEVATHDLARLLMILALFFARVRGRQDYFKEIAAEARKAETA